MERGNLIVFMGEAARRQFIRRAVLDRGFVAADRITTFARLKAACAGAARRAGLLDRPEADVLSRTMIILDVVVEAAAEFAGQGVLGRVSTGALAGVLESMADTLAPFGEAAEAIHAWLLKRPAESKARQLGQLYGVYRRRLQAAGLAETRDVCAAVIDLLCGPPENWPPVLSTLEGCVHFRALTWLDPFAEQFIQILAEQLGKKRVLLSSALPPAHAESMEDRLAAQIRTEVLAGLEQDAWSAWTEGLGDALAVEDAQLAADSRDRLSFIRSAGLQGEVEDLARRIRREMDHQRVPPERIALVVRQPGEYLETIARVFDEFSIPFFCRRGRPASSTASLRLLLALLQFPLDPARDRLCALLQSPALTWPGFADPDARRQAAVEILAAGVGPSLQPEDWRPTRTRPGRVSEAVRSPVAAALAKLGLWAPPSAEAPLKEHARRALDIAAFFDLAQAADNASLPVREQVASRRALDQALDLLRRLERESQSDSSRFTWGGFLDLLGRLWGTVTVPTGWSEEYGVWVVSPADMAGLSFDVVLIAGLNEGSFPAVAREDAVFSDEERTALQKALARRGVKLPQWSLPLSSVRSAQERFLFLTCLGAAREQLVLSCQTTDGDGRDLNPGDFFRSLWALAGGPAEVAPPPGESWWATVPLPQCQTPAEARRRLGRLIEDPAAAKDAEKTILLSFAGGAGAGAGARLEHRIGVEHARETFFNTRAADRPQTEPYCGKIEQPSTRERVAAWLAARGALSPTALESLARCRYRFLLGSVCRLGAVRLQEEAPDVLDRGRVIHDILDQLYRGLRGDAGQPEVLENETRDAFADLRRTRVWAVEEKPGRWCLRERPGLGPARSLPLVTFVPGAEDRYLEYVRLVADAVFARAEKKGGRLGDAGVWETEKPKIRCIAENYLALDLAQAAAERRYPALFELMFGGDDQPELRVGSGKKGVRLHGRVDRVDLLFDEAGRLCRLLVVDYKGVGRGGLSADKYAEEIAENLDCQLPVYAFAAQQFLFGRCNEPELNAMTGMVFHTQNRDADEMARQFGKRRIPLVDDESGSITERFAERLAANLARLRAADFSVDPLDCNYCDFNHICRVDVNAMESLTNTAE
ncbi:MAG: PD-(D/E)XK nuclease family protein [Verrucomicrobia bacterium]|nr:PD-(D/E)XK nuclease family protein [Verrucomicrobiota bacterium]